MGELVPFIVDRGACNYIISVDYYNKPKSKIKLQPVTDNGNLFGCSSKSKLDNFCWSNAAKSCRSKQTRAVFYVYNGITKCFLSHKTADRLFLESYSDSVVGNVLPESSYVVFNCFPAVF